MSQNAVSPTMDSPAPNRGGAPAHLSVVSSVDETQFRVSVYQSLDDCAVAWRLFESEARATVFQRHAWLNAWMHTVGCARGIEPRIALVRNAAGDLVMILPLAIERTLGVAHFIWLAQDEADYHGPLIHPDWNTHTPREEIGRILTAIVASTPEVKAFSLTKTLATIEGMANPLQAIKHAAHPSSGHAITLTGDCFDTFYAEMRSKSTRKRDRQRRRRLEESGEVEFRIPETQSDQHAMLDAILAQKALWLKQRGIVDPFGSAEVKSFFHHLIDDQSARSTLHISALTVDGDVVAGNVGFVRNDRFYATIGCVTDGEASRHSPGTIHLHELLRWCYANNIKAFDLTVGDEGYKKDWCDAHLELVDIRVPVTFTGYLSLLPSRIKDRIKRHIKASPYLLDKALSARRTLRTLLTP